MARVRVTFLAEKGVHMALFTTMGFVLWSMFPARQRSVMIVLAVGAVIGVCSEILQIFTGRDPSIRDAVLNACGVAMGMAIARMSGSETSAVDQA